MPSVFPMPFEVFKARVKIVRDEEVVKKWVEEQSFRAEYTCLNVPEPLKLPNREEVEKHFRAVHKDAIIKPVESHTIGGVLSRNLRCRELQRPFARWERQKYFPLQLATCLSRQFTAHGLHFFKVNGPSPMFPSPVRRSSTSKPRRIRKTSGASSATSTRIRIARSGIDRSPCADAPAGGH